MKRFTLLGIALGAVLITSVVAQQFVGLMSLRDNTVGTNAMVIFPGSLNRVLALREYNVTGDNADVLIEFKSGTRVTQITNTLWTASTNIGVLSTNGWLQGDWGVVQRQADGVCCAVQVYGIAAGTVQIYATNAVTAGNGDYLWRMALTATNAIGSNTVSESGYGLWSAQLQAPMLIRVGTAAGSAEKINRATCEYVVPQ